MVQVSPQIVLLQFVADRLHLGQLFQQRLVLLLYQLEQAGLESLDVKLPTEPAGYQEGSEPLYSRQERK